MGPKRPELTPPATPGLDARGPRPSEAPAFRPPGRVARYITSQRDSPARENNVERPDVAAYYKEMYEEEKRRREVLEVIAWQNNTPNIAHAAPPGKYQSVRFVQSPLTSPTRIMQDLLTKLEEDNEKANKAKAEADRAEADFARIFQAFVGLAQDLHYDKDVSEESISQRTRRSLKSRVEEVTDLHPHMSELSAQMAEDYERASPVFRVSGDLSIEGARKLRQETERDVRLLGEAIRNQ